MPLTVKEGALLGSGMLLASGATLFYKRKQTAAFKWCYFLAWPTLGSAIILTTSPSREGMEQVTTACTIMACGSQAPALLQPR